jgi:hypothetical protein
MENLIGPHGEVELNDDEYLRQFYAYNKLRKTNSFLGTQVFTNSHGPKAVPNPQLTR